MKRYLPAAVLIFIALACYAAGSGTDAADLSARLLPPSLAHPLGTDELGRDVLRRLLAGGQISLAVGLAAALAATLVGTAVGVMAGFAGGKTDAVLMRMTDMLIALPALPLLIILSAVDGEKIGFDTGAGGGLYKIILLIAILGWTSTARLTRARALTVRHMDYVTAARALGASHAHIILRHILPNVMPTVIVAAALAVGNVILMESTLSFLGLGIQPPVASWGNMLSNAEETIWEAPLLTLWPGLMILVTVLCCNFIGDAVDDTHQPRKQSK
jgi:peptide/nickel transport system permease protein